MHALLFLYLWFVFLSVTLNHKFINIWKEEREQKYRLINQLLLKTNNYYLTHYSINYSLGSHTDGFNELNVFCCLSLIVFFWFSKFINESQANIVAAFQIFELWSHVSNSSEIFVVVVSFSFFCKRKTEQRNKEIIRIRWIDYKKDPFFVTCCWRHVRALPTFGPAHHRISTKVAIRKLLS